MTKPSEKKIEKKLEKKIEVKVEKVEKIKEVKVIDTGTKTQLPENKQKIIDEYAQKKGDTGSPEVQVALLSYKIQNLAAHLEINKKDNHSRRGLLKVIAKRRRIINYLQRLNVKRYKVLINKLGLKK
ncbi:30S ribosomal protein S15 [Candidatus Roizmanbacteria bacterium CG_4_9_14_0_8_um_filter_34_12]|uniref:Small ribosomal subunit protein uS15 n=4 Tax=Candidatus Roizmaniibacteriota TaxID=1752723 RepID=A0A2M7E5A5_9BACT|nr:30S ribosomal protein S15 [Candidatus Roizmanbacteria bacterium]PIP64895.1 MAG: 30S ribosomal protein S15 [Candidatus Roizmanbacteria bacterium CG22_combo_CG10-13_8_21_14_all_33_16]PIV62906.1 MAG: 30S ribosomal protein S15 [Candidatus Roizmanbacteria bacterium CG01_land_8_20_14_3_00_33_9]PIX70129.1 MAG: 30S ribosomal protein S15 [Candidatus Roizmanbacteria bacterium CG_4_10_14_3_um_filter_33_21]PJB88927.1 MAG: 30S ribosomal protein S15 [Candidatus Roizmanbacteria bacterium CG_4_9_14_0_8_um_f